MTAEEKAFVFEDWLSDGIKGMRENLKRKKRRKPSAVRQHLRSACKETLLVTRSVFDEAIEYLEAEPEPKKAPSAQPKAAEPVAQAAERQA